MKRSRFVTYAWSVLIYTLLVILWGAFVRATGSGAGCGSHWPLCNGEVIPRAPAAETLIEFTHRLTSGLSGLLVIVLLVWALRAFPKKHPVRLGAWLSFAFIISESLVGAGLVKFGWVAGDASVERAITMAVHLINTFLLLASLTLTVWWASGGPALRVIGRGFTSWGLVIGLAGMLLLGVSGALTALGDTLFPAASLREGLQQDFSPTAHFLIRLRLWHPTIAVAVSAYLMLLVNLSNLGAASETARRLSRLLTALLLVQLAAGLLNVALLAPVWMQIVHLLLADIVWITLVFLAAAVLARTPVPARLAGPVSLFSTPTKS
jgi:heme A synthase